MLRTSFWFTMAMATAGLIAGLLLSGMIADLLFGSSGDSELVMAAFVGLWAGMNYEQLTSLFRVEERSIAIRLGKPGEHPAHDRRYAASRRRARSGPDRCHRRQLHGHLARLRSAGRVPPRAARPPVRPRTPPGDEPLRGAADPDGALPLGHELQRPDLPRPARGYDRGRLVLGRRPHRIGDGAAADGVPAGLARVRVPDRGRRRGEADVRVRPHLSRPSDHVGRRRSRPPLALDRRLDRRAGVRGVLACGRPAGVRCCRLWRLHRRGDRCRPRTAYAVQLGRDRSRSRQ